MSALLAGALAATGASLLLAAPAPAPAGRAAPPAGRDPEALPAAPARVAAGVGVGVLVHWFVGGALGLAVGAAAGAAVAWRLGRLEPPGVRARRARLRADLPWVVDLLAASLRAGQDPSRAAALVAAAVRGPAGELLDGVARRTALGVPAVDAWRSLLAHPGAEPLGLAMGRAVDSGAQVTDVVERLATDLRADALAEAGERARAVGVRATAPIGACLLPAVLVVGVVPLVAGLLGTLLAGF